jgi:hypothetical protein
VVVFGQDVHTTPTVVTVEGVFSSAYSANPTLITVEGALLLSFTVIEAADLTIILTKVFFTGGTRLAFGLLIATSQTLDILDSLAIHLVILLRIHLRVVVDLIVAQSTRIVLALTDGVGALKHARSLVVSTAHLAIFELF